jgi:thiol-disulfide isomerase/thioredoxin
MKTFFYLLLFLSGYGYCFGQQDSRAPYLRFPTIPPIDLVQLDSSHLTKEQLTKNQKTLIMFFSPGCDHCQHQTRDMLQGMSKLKDIQIVMASYQPSSELQEFYQKYDLARFSNIKIGRDSKFMLPPYYRMKNLPYLALYREDGTLVTTFEGNISVEKLVSEFDTKK